MCLVSPALQSSDALTGGMMKTICERCMHVKGDLQKGKI